MQANRFDAATGQLGVTVVREKVVDMIGMLLGNELFTALTDSPIKVNSLEDLGGLTAATVVGVEEALAARGASFLYLPSYSPNMNPIELAFAKYKRGLRTAAARRKPLPRGSLTWGSVRQEKFHLSIVLFLRIGRDPSTKSVAINAATTTASTHIRSDR